LLDHVGEFSTIQTCLAGAHQLWNCRITLHHCERNKS